MLKIIKKSLHNFLWKSNGDVFCRRFNFMNTLHYKWPIKIEYIGENFKIIDSETHIFINRKERIDFYRQGVSKRLHFLASSYLLNQVEFTSEDTVIDCGANIGELGMWLRRFNLSYLAFEQSKKEYNCAKLNNTTPSSNVFNNALWKESCTLKFYDKNDTGDSSVFKVNDYHEVTEVKAKSLQSIIDSLGIDKIKLLKLEAEGAEPEILEGLADDLIKVQFISVDCGFERGLKSSSTLPEVTNMLLARGFKVRGVSSTRLVLLFENTNYK